MAYRLTRTAEATIDRILLESARSHGVEAASRYNLLILSALHRLGEDPGLVGSIEVPRLPGIRAYPIRLNRLAIAAGRRVRAPRHLIIYRRTVEGLVEVLGLAHDRMVLSRAARKAAEGDR